MPSRDGAGAPVTAHALPAPAAAARAAPAPRNVVAGRCLAAAHGTVEADAQVAAARAVAAAAVVTVTVAVETVGGAAAPVHEASAGLAAGRVAGIAAGIAAAAAATVTEVDAMAATKVTGAAAVTRRGHRGLPPALTIGRARGLDLCRRAGSERAARTGIGLDGT